MDILHPSQHLVSEELDVLFVDALVRLYQLPQVGRHVFLDHVNVFELLPTRRQLYRFHFDNVVVV